MVFTVLNRLYNKIKAAVVSFLYKNYQVDIEPSLIYISCRSGGMGRRWGLKNPW